MRDCDEAEDQRIGPQARKVLVAAGIGHFIEWYDVGTYGLLAAYLAANFFVSDNPTAGLLATFAVSAVGFVLRPLGGLFFGPLGDRIGRQRTLVIVVLLTSGSTFAMGALPTYDSVGILAPVLLVIARMLQGFGAGGETSNAVALLFEHSPRTRRGYTTSWMDGIGFVASVAGSALALVLINVLGDGAMTEWGWRIPFLLALPLGLVGLYLRVQLADSPEFRELEAEGDVAESPTKEAFRTGYKAMLVLCGILLLKAIGHWALVSFLPSFLSGDLGFSSSETFTTTTIAIGITAIAVPVMGAVSDRVGRKPMLIAGSAGFVVCSWPAFYLMSLGNLVAAISAMLLLGLLIAVFDGALSAMMAEQFPARIRSGAMAIPYNLVVSAFGGTVPYVATWMVASTGSKLAPSFYVMFLAAVTLVVAITAIRETAPRRTRAAGGRDPEPTRQP
ncbi:MFS transporter [Streptomyces rutgersensis]|uniref:MFS transporter n=1 Tax=Streptomyces rutgersensis TaxID=53451 RepID=UPI0013C76EDA|nr:MFS transporter [Streptomyces rutgersensis]GFH67300.1 MFS transporter [Streptomyces rutgersensis]